MRIKYGQVFNLMFCLHCIYVKQTKYKVEIHAKSHFPFMNLKI